MDNFTISSIISRFSAFRLFSLRPRERGFKMQILCLWQGSENCSDEIAQRTVNGYMPLFEGRTLLLREMVTMMRSRDVIHKGPASIWCMIHISVSVIIPIGITFWLILIYTYIYIYIYIYLHVYIYIYVCVCVCEYVYIYIYIYKVGDRSQGRPEGSLFNSYYPEMLGRALLLSFDCATLLL